MSYLFFISISEFLYLDCFFTQASIAVLVTENNDGKDMWKAKTAYFLFISSDKVYQHGSSGTFMCPKVVINKHVCGTAVPCRKTLHNAPLNPR